MTKYRVVGLSARQSFYWNGGNYRVADVLTVDDDTPPEAIRHLLHYPDSLMARGLVEELKPTHKKADPEKAPAGQE